MLYIIIWTFLVMGLDFGMILLAKWASKKDIENGGDAHAKFTCLIME